ncbi:MAG: hypothetical protein M5U01_39680 [Ardenticatenaceae bacterium]|nr:hypothetical protein [Ardenticatenaceae bacterium]HBY96211.1 hypothetical protein [Chloroflexota bacterium]
MAFCIRRPVQFVAVVRNGESSDNWTCNQARRAVEFGWEDDGQARAAVWRLVVLIRGVPEGTINEPTA